MPVPSRTSDEVMAELRRRRLSHRSIAEACDVLLGWRLTEEHVRQRLHTLGFPKIDNRARPGEQNGGWRHG